MKNVEKVSLNGSELRLSQLVQGYWRLMDWGINEQECLRYVKQHLELGISTVDHANIYGAFECEAMFGRALKLDPSLREQLQIISKCGIVLPEAGRVGYYDLSKAKIIRSVEASLQRLQIEQLDLLLLHRPDYLLQANEVAAAFDQLHADGKVANFGVSNFEAYQLDLLHSSVNVPLVTNQIELNPVNLENIKSGLLERMQQLGIKPMAWSCLAGGQLFSGVSEQHQRLRQCLEEVAGEIGAGTIDQVIYAWILKLPSNPILILGTKAIERVITAISALEFDLTHEQWYRIFVASQGYRVP